MDVSAELDRIFPASLQEADLTAAQNQLFELLAKLTKEQYEIALNLLPDKPKLEFEDTIQNVSPLPFLYAKEVSVKQTFWDVVGHFAVSNYLSHCSATYIFSLILKRKKGRAAVGVGRLIQKMSPEVRNGLFNELLDREAKDPKGRPSTQGELEDVLEVLVHGHRIGAVELTVEELLNTYKDPKRKYKNRGTSAGILEVFFLRKIQEKRRGEFPGRVTAIDTVHKARFACEEIRRELYSYPSFEPKYVIRLIDRVYGWYRASKGRQIVLKSPSIMQYSYFFDELNGLRARIHLAVDHGITDISEFLRPQWEYVVGKFVPSPTFWHGLQGLQGEVPLEETEAGQNIALYRRMALAAGAVYVAVIILPVVGFVAIRTPGTIVSVVRWAGGRMLLGTQYVYTTMRVFGLSAGMQRIATDIYHVYLRHAITINQAINTLTEISLDLSMGGTGMAPGSSPGDMATAMTQKVATVAGKGFAKLADEVADLAKGPMDEIKAVEMVVKSEIDGNYYRLLTVVDGGTGNIAHLRVEKYESLGKYVDPEIQKKILFHSAPKNQNAIDAAQDAARAVDQKPAAAVVDDLNTRQLQNTGTDYSVPTMSAKRPPPSSTSQVGRLSPSTTQIASKTGRSTIGNGVPQTSRLSGPASKAPPKLPIDLSRPGAMKGLVSATQEEVVLVLKDPRIFKIWKSSLRTSQAGSAQAANDIEQLGNAIARFTARSPEGAFRAEKAVSDAVWSLPAHLRGVIIEHSLAATQYKEWVRAGQLDRGFFPDIDWALIKHGLDQRVSLKTVSPIAKAYETRLTETLIDHLESLVTGVQNGRGRGYRMTALLDVRMPLGSAIPRADLLDTLMDQIPSDVKRWVSVVVDEF